MTKLLVEAERLESSISRHEWNWGQWKDRHPGNTLPPEYIDEEGELRPPFQAVVHALYIATVALVDAKLTLPHIHIHQEFII